MNYVNTLCAFVLLLFSFSLDAQVKFKLRFDFQTERYVVSVIPMATYVYPNNITGTGQVTIKVPTNKFFPVDIVSYLQGMEWDANSRNNAPSEAPDFDYISFGLAIQGIAYPEYLAGVELPLFSFENAYGCIGNIYLVDNITDPFMPPNSLNANIGNTLTIMGAGGDAFAGVEGPLTCSCDGNATTDTKEKLALEAHRIFPNPAIDFTTVEINWTGESTEAFLQIVDAAGKKVLIRELTLVNGGNTEKLLLNNLPAGNYWVYLTGAGWEVSLDKFAKIVR